MSRLNVHKTEVLIDECNREKLLILLADVSDWPIRESQVDTVKRFFDCRDLKRQLEQAAPNAPALEEQIRMFLRGCAVSRPARALSWEALVK